MLGMMDAAKQQSVHIILSSSRSVQRLCVQLCDRGEASRNGHSSGQRAPSAPSPAIRSSTCSSAHRSIRHLYIHPSPPFFSRRQAQRRPLACLFRSHVASFGAQRRRLRSAHRPDVSCHHSLLRGGAALLLDLLM